MATFGELEIDRFYLVKIKEEDEITMVQVGMATEKCVLVYSFDDDYETSVWKKKDDSIAELVEALTDEQVDEYEALLEDDEDEADDFNLEFDEEDFNEEEEEETDEDDEEDDDDEEEEKEEKKKKKKKKK